MKLLWIKSIWRNSPCSALLSVDTPLLFCLSPLCLYGPGGTLHSRACSLSCAAASCRISICLASRRSSWTYNMCKQQGVRQVDVWSTYCTYGAWQKSFPIFTVHKHNATKWCKTKLTVNTHLHSKHSLLLKMLFIHIWTWIGIYSNYNCTISDEYSEVTFSL